MQVTFDAVLEIATDEAKQALIAQLQAAQGGCRVRVAYGQTLVQPLDDSQLAYMAAHKRAVVLKGFYGERNAPAAAKTAAKRQTPPQG